jgi:hypothetical protein
MKEAEEARLKAEVEAAEQLRLENERREKVSTSLLCHFTCMTRVCIH